MEGDTIVIKYFPSNGRSALIKCMLDIAKVPFTSIEYSLEEWETLNKTDEEFEYKFLPVVTINGKHYSQTLAIETLIAKKLGFMGSTPEDQYEITNLLASREDLQPGIYPILLIFTEEQLAKLEDNFKNLIDNYLKWILPIYNKKIKARKGKYFIGDNISLGDMYFAVIYSFLVSPFRKDRLEEVLKSCAPDLIEYSEGLINNELKDYFINGSFKKETII